MKQVFGIAVKTVYYDLIKFRSSSVNNCMEGSGSATIK